MTVSERKQTLAQRRGDISSGRGITQARQQQEQQRQIANQQALQEQEIQRINKIIEESKNAISEKESELNSLTNEKIQIEKQFIASANALNIQTNQILSAQENFQRSTMGQDPQMITNTLDQFKAKLEAVNQTRQKLEIPRQEIDNKIKTVKKYLFSEIDNYSQYLEDGKSIAKQMKSDYETNIQNAVESEVAQARELADIQTAQASQSLLEARRRGNAGTTIDPKTGEVIPYYDKPKGFLDWSPVFEDFLN